MDFRFDIVWCLFVYFAWCLYCVTPFLMVVIWLCLFVLLDICCVCCVSLGWLFNSVVILYISLFGCFVVWLCCKVCIVDLLFVFCLFAELFCCCLLFGCCQFGLMIWCWVGLLVLNLLWWGLWHWSFTLSFGYVMLGCLLGGVVCFWCCWVLFIVYCVGVCDWLGMLRL